MGLGVKAKTDEPLVEIYELIDPRDESVRYIGKAKDSQKRLKGHLRDSRRRNTPVYAWIRKLESLGMVPKMRVASKITADEWEHEERRLIFEARLIHPKLLNVADGGDEPKCSVETQRANGQKLNDRIAGDPVMKRVHHAKKILGMALKKGMLREETKDKMRSAARNNPKIFGKWAAI